jgi:hypothetical protein
MIVLLAASASLAVATCRPFNAVSRRQDDFLCHHCLKGLDTHLCNWQVLGIGFDVGKEGLDFIGGMLVPPNRQCTLAKLVIV